MRKTDIVVVPEWGKRDAGKVFFIREWPAERRERLLGRAEWGAGRWAEVRQARAPDESPPVHA